MPARPELMPGTDHPTLLFGENEPSWGTAALIDGGMLYVFACDGDGFAPACSLAHVDPARVTDRSAWQYWNDGAWSASQKSTLFTGAPTVSVAWNAHLQKYLAVYCEPLSNRVVARTAPARSPARGRDARLLFEAKRDPDGAYDANWHPELDDGATLYVTFSRPNGMGWFGSEFALVRVTLP